MRRSKRYRSATFRKVQAVRKRHRTPAHEKPERDGGAWSLAGYTYQLLGSAAARVSLENLSCASTCSATVRFVLEEYGQDAVATVDNKTRLIQFKYSPSSRPLAPRELADVLRTLQTSNRSAPKSAAVDWYLVTNRRLSSEATRLLSIAKRGQRKSRRSVIRKNPHARVILRLGSRLAVELYDADQLEAMLLKEAAKMGVDDVPGIVDRAVSLMHRTAVRSAGRRNVSLAMLRDALAGYIGARSISLADCKESLRTELTDIAAAYRGGVGLHHAIARRDLQAIVAETNTALAVVHGPGGCGKSLSLLKVLDDQLASSSSLAGAIVQSLPTRRRTCGELVAAWRNAPERGDTPRDALRRLQLANGNLARPILFLGLDGFDEVPDRDRGSAEELILYFHDLHLQARSRNEPSEALLIVTCRQLEDFREIIGPLGTGEPDLPTVPDVDLGEFSDDEFAAVWALWFSEEPLPIQGVPSGMATMATEDPRVAQKGRLVAALRHPVLLGCLKSLSSEKRRKLLEGDSVEWNDLLAVYCRWFAHKAAMRSKCSQPIVMSILRAVARTTSRDETMTTYERDAHWVDPGTTETGQPPFLVKRIFQDAVTAGVIVAGSTRFEQPVVATVPWKWQFPMLQTFLCSLNI
jgi:hypothetical protein